MELVRLIRSRVEGKSPLDPKVFRTARPVRNPVVTAVSHEEGLILTTPRETRSGLLGILESRMNVPATKQYELDQVGAVVWNLCDGKSNLSSIAKNLQTRYKMNRLEAETALAAYLETLHKRGLITILVKEKK